MPTLVQGVFEIWILSYESKLIWIFKPSEVLAQNDGKNYGFNSFIDSTQNRIFCSLGYTYPFRFSIELQIKILIGLGDISSLLCKGKS